MRVAALQSDIVWEDPQANFDHLEPWIERAKDAGAELLALPEMYACGFSMATERIAEPMDGPSARFLIDGAGRHGLWLAGSVPERAEGAGRPANTLILAGPDGPEGQTVHRYRKIHPFTYAGEHEHYVAGTERITIDIAGTRVTPFVCYDLRFADEFWAMAEDTDLYLVVANWPDTRARHWIALLQARAIENQAYVLGVNRVGSGGKLHYSGDSRILDPMGDVIVAASGQETLLVADVDPAVVRDTRASFPFLRDRR